MNSHRSIKFQPKAILTYTILLLTYLPLLTMIIYSFNKSRFVNEWTGLSLRWYAQMINDSALIRASTVSLIVATTAGILSIVLGVPAAIYSYRLLQSKPILRNKLSSIFYLPLITPDLALAVAISFFLSLTGVGFGIKSIVLAHTTWGIAFSFLFISIKLADLDPNIIKAGEDVGASNLQIFFGIILPIVWKSVVASFIIIFILSFSDFIYAFFTSGPGSTTLPIFLYSSIKFRLTPTVTCVFSIILILGILGVFLSNKLIKFVKFLTKI